MNATIRMCSVQFRCRSICNILRLLSTKTKTKNDSNMDTEHHFGFETVSEKEKYKKVHRVFENVAEKYDLMNDVMSLGIHRLWKDYFMSQLAPPEGTQLLDVAGGTGDIAFRFLSYINNEKTPTDTVSVSNPFDQESEETSLPTPDEPDSPASHVTVCDISEAMLHHGRKRAEKLGFFESDITWVQGNAEDLPFDDNTFDAYTISFGIRNCTHIDNVLKEAHRVLKPAGRFLCLEFSEVNNYVLKQLYDAYSFQLIPVMGQVWARDWKSYQYLVESIRRFPTQDTFADMIRDAGFRFVSCGDLTFGVAAIHSGYKPCHA